jgi:hypothetical protein
MVIQLSGNYGENNDAQMKCKRENKIWLMAIEKKKWNVDETMLCVKIMKYERIENVYT